MEDITFQEGDSKSFDTLLKSHMDKPLKHFEKELAAIRTGRASTALIEGLRVECYGQFMALKDIASIAAPDARLLTIQPWDKGSIADIEKAITQSDLGLTPANDGSIIRLQLPQMSSTRRDELVKILGKKTEECKINIRNVRKDFHNQVRDAEKKRVLSEDFGKRLSDLLQKTTDTFIEKTDQIYEKKAAELRQV